MLNLSGRAPVVTLGRKAQQPTRLWIGPKSQSVPLLALYLENGTWEAQFSGDRLTLDCDTPEIAFEAQGRPFKTTPKLVEVPLVTRTTAKDF